MLFRRHPRVMELPAAMTERHAKGLAELAELALVVARDLQGRIAQAETPDEAAKLASGFHRVARTVRQTYALEARMQRDLMRDRLQVVEHQAAETAQAPARRRAEVKAQLDRLVWTEAEDEVTAKYWEEGAKRLLAEAELADDFTTRPAADLIDDLARTLRDTKPPSNAPPAEVVNFEWRIIYPEESQMREAEARHLDPPRQGAAGTQGAQPHHLGPPLQGEVAAQPTEGVQAHAPLPPTSAAALDAGGLNPLSPFGTAPPGGEHLTEAAAHEPIPIGLPGEFGPNGESGDDRIFERCI